MNLILHPVLNHYPPPALCVLPYLLNGYGMGKPSSGVEGVGWKVNVARCTLEFVYLQESLDLDGLFPSNGTLKSLSEPEQGAINSGTMNYRHTVLT